MNPETPMLMITMQIPVLPDTDANQVMAAISEQLTQALEEIKRKHLQANEVEGFEEPEDSETAAFRASVLKETLESYTDDTKSDLLVAMGYKATT